MSAEVRISADGQIEIRCNGETWKRHHFGDWRVHGPHRDIRLHEHEAPREVKALWAKAVKAALSLNGVGGPSEAEHPRVVDLS